MSVKATPEQWKRWSEMGATCTVCKERIDRCRCGMAFPSDTEPAGEPKSESEKSFHWRVHNLAESLGWKIYHTWLSIRSDPGFPDLVCLRGKRFLVAEVKKDGEKPTKAQEEWLQAFRESGAEVFVWRPADWPEIETVLA